MPINTKELREKREAAGQAFSDFHMEVESKLESENRTAWTGEEQEKFDQLEKSFRELADRVKRAEAAEVNLSVEEASEETREDSDREEFEARQAERHGYHRDPNRPVTEVERHLALQAWFLGRNLVPTEAQRTAAKRCGIDLSSDDLSVTLDRGYDIEGFQHQAPRSITEIKRQSEHRREVRLREQEEYRNTGNLESRQQTVGTGSEGGFTVPDSMMRPLEVALLAYGGMRTVATVLSTDTGSDLPIPTANDTAQKGAIVAESGAITQQDVTFGQLVLNSYKYTSKYVPVSWELLQDSSVNMPQFLGEALGERLGRILNEHFTTGTGTGQPNGVVTAAADSSVTTAAATTITHANMLGLKHSVDPAYRARGGTWMFNDSTFLLLKTMLDGDNRPMWNPNVIPGEAGTFDGDGYVINQDMANGASAKAVLYGDFSKYLIRDVRNITLRRLDELHALNGHVTFFAWGRWDGDLLNAGTNPIKYLTMGA